MRCYDRAHARADADTQLRLRQICQTGEKSECARDMSALGGIRCLATACDLVAVTSTVRSGVDGPHMRRVVRLRARARRP